MAKGRSHCEQCVVLLVLALVGSGAVAYPYADDFPYHLHPVHRNPPAVGQGGKKVLLGSSGAKGASGGGEGASDARDHSKDHAFEEAGGINSASDAVRYHQLDNQLNGHRVVDANKGSTVDKVKHLAGENFEADKSHNRKHVKSGFSNSYHKDESGSKSSYYEDSDDRGGKQVYDNRHNLRNDYADKLYSQDRRSDYLRDHYDDRVGGTDLLGAHNYQRASALDRGNAHGHRDGYAHNDHSDQHYDTRAYDAYGYYQHPATTTSSYHYTADPYRRRSAYYEPRPTFATAPITIYEDPRDYVAPYGPYPAYPSVREVRDGTSVLSRDADYQPATFDELGHRRRLIYKPSPASLPYDGFRRY
ncbi:AGAP000734-PA-like protein [Anopheles sinensis]|uniref:AGAP000734-PA-like protein n=1 Tax=Anopheles sinensis TaxID=74873 RepID=A0A084VFQ9_ANOSI|nr:AGAP000734-PA-like protein [Anopheles sinensis]